MYGELASYTFRTSNSNYPFIRATTSNHTLLKYLDCKFITNIEKLMTCQILLNDRLLFPYQRRSVKQIEFELETVIEYDKLKEL